MLQNNEKSAEVLKAEKIVEQAKARLAEAKRKASQQKRKEENQHKYMMGGIVHKYFPECYQFDEQELNRIIASGMKSEQCQRIIEIVKKESADKRENAVVKAESEVAGDEGTDKAEAVAMYPGVQKMLDKLAKTNIIHKNKAAIF